MEQLNNKNTPLQDELDHTKKEIKNAPLLYKLLGFDVEKTLLNNILAFFFDYKGRLNRQRYMIGLFLLFVFPMAFFSLYFLFLKVFFAIFGEGATYGLIILVYLFVPVWLILFVSGIILQIKRLHDMNYSGFWVLINLADFIPLVGTLILLAFAIVLFCKKGTTGANDYGEDPLL